MAAASQAAVCCWSCATAAVLWLTCYLLVEGNYGMHFLLRPLALESPEGAHQRLHFSKNTHTHTHRRRWTESAPRVQKKKKTDNLSLICGMIITFDSASLTTVLCDGTGCGVLQIWGGAFGGSSHGCHYTCSLTAFIFPSLCSWGEHRNDSISILPRSVRCALMQSIFYFLSTLLVTVHWGKLVSLPAESQAVYAYV